MAYEQGEIRDSANNIILAGSWGIKTPFKDIINILAENGRALKSDGITAAASVPWSGITGKPTDLAGYGIITESDARYAPNGYGLGGAAKDISNTDLNALLTTQKTGWYRGSGMANAPDACWWFITHISHTDANWCVQYATSYQTAGYQYGAGVTFVRSAHNVNGSVVWTAWKQLATTDSPTFTGFVGIGTTAPNRTLYVSSNEALYGTLLAYNTNTSYTGVVAQFKSEEAAGNAAILRCDNAITAGLFSVNSAGLVTTSGQIKFPATQNASADPNTLDDYEEGTFTPIVYGMGTEGVGTYSTQSGIYTKLGRDVNFIITLAWSAHTGVGVMRVKGLPFVLNGNHFPCKIEAYNMVFNGQLTALALGNTNTISIRQMFSNTPIAECVLDTSVDVLWISGTYFV